LNSAVDEATPLPVRITRSGETETANLPSCEFSSGTIQIEFVVRVCLSTVEWMCERCRRCWSIDEMISSPAGAHIWIAAGVADLRRGFTGLSAIAQMVLQQDPFAGHVFVFRGRRGDLIKLLWWDGDGLCPFAKHLERGRFIWRKAVRSR
jgi:transposase